MATYSFQNENICNTLGHSVENHFFNRSEENCESDHTNISTPLSLTNVVPIDYLGLQCSDSIPTEEIIKVS